MRALSVHAQIGQPGFPRALRDAVVQKAGALLRDIAKTEETKAFLTSAAATPLLNNSVAEATEVVRSDRDLWRKVTTEARIEPQG